MNKSMKAYAAAIKPHGLMIEKSKKHYKITRDGNTVAIVSHSGEVNAIRQSMRDLARAGLVPNELRRLKF